MLLLPEYRIIVNDNNIQIITLSGEPIHYSHGLMLRDLMIESYEEKKYLYLCEAFDSDLLKVGVSNDPNRRMNELDAKLLHFIQCRPKKVYVHEKGLHKLFRRWRVKGEWFDFGEDKDKVIRSIKTIQNERDLRHWIWDHQILHEFRFLPGE